MPSALSEAAIAKEDNISAELIVDVWNVNYGQNMEMLEQCESLGAYSYFIACVREEQGKGTPLDEAIAIAIQNCIRKDIMQEFLKKNGSEVENMLLTEWNWDDAKRVWQEEAREEGKIQNLCELFADGDISFEKAVKRAGMAESAQI